MRKRGRKPRIIVVSCPFFYYFIVQVQNVSSPLHNLICGLVHISEERTPTERQPDDAERYAVDESQRSAVETASRTLRPLAKRLRSFCQVAE